MVDMRVRRTMQSLTDVWRQIPIMPRGATLLGISFRSPVVASLGMDSRMLLRTLLAYPIHLIRLGAYWNRIEPRPGTFVPDELDWQMEAAERAGVQIILCLGPLKVFGYPEFFVPAHHLHVPLREHTLVHPTDYPLLSEAATTFLHRVVERYRDHPAIAAWQLEHEAVDPLGFEHSWRLSVDFVAREVDTLKQADPTRPIILNGFLPTTWPVLLAQWWRTRDQGDSLAVAQNLADIVGVDYYPRQALVRLGHAALYLDGSRRRRQAIGWKPLVAAAHARGHQLMVTEGQAEPWETTTTPPNPVGRAMSSCLPEHVIVNYNACLRLFQHTIPLYAYLFWGAEYWVRRAQSGDPSYLNAFVRILEKDAVSVPKNAPGAR
jgi:Beta-galactosidase